METLTSKNQFNLINSQLTKYNCTNKNHHHHQHHLHHYHRHCSKSPRPPKSPPFTGYFLMKVIISIIITFTISVTNSSPVTELTSTPSTAVNPFVTTSSSFSIVNVTIDMSPSPLTQRQQQASFQSSPSTSNLNWLNGNAMVDLKNSKSELGDLTIPSLNGQPYCPFHCDGISCWPSTLAGVKAVIPCFKYFKGVQYDDSGKFLLNFTFQFILFA